MSEMRWFAFGDAESATWGSGWLAEPGSGSQVAVALGPAAHVVEATLGPNGPEEAWRLEGDALSLEIAPAGPAARGGMTEELQTLDQVCAVSGRVGLPDGPAEVRCPGWRSSASSAFGLEKLGSFRWLAAWLGPHHGFSLLALRPRRAKGQEDDVVAATVIDDPPVPRVDDPRLSTTYDESGLPRRAGLELWLDAETDPGDDADAPQYPRRAAGLVVNQGPSWTPSGFGLHASFLRWRSHDLEGPGVYVLGRRL